jgi:hypothetical protein
MTIDSKFGKLPDTIEKEIDELEKQFMSNEPVIPFEEQLGTASSEKLCEVIVSQRYLGIMRDEAILCMKELAKRRASGDTFEFEKRIEEILNSLPKIKIDMNEVLRTPGIGSIFSGMGIGGNKK